MFDWFTLHVLAVLVVAVQFGGILLFAAMFTPLVFRNLPAETAASFLHSVFPVYYRVMGILALVAALPLVPGQSYMGEISALVAVALGYVVLNTIVRPAANKARDEDRRGAFRQLHRLSVAIHLVQFAVISVVLVRLIQ
jgi:hypothetical protein